MVLWIAERLLPKAKMSASSLADIAAQRIAPPTAADAPATRNAAITTSDEVRMLQSRLGEPRPVRCRRRIATRTAGELAKRGVNWFVLDDGFQHLQLARDVDIVLIDATNPFGGGRLLPAGRLREPRSALARADIIVITRSAHAPAIESAIRRETDASIFYARPKLDAIHSFTKGQLAGTVSPEELRKLFAFCAIGNPAAFLADLRAWGLEIVGHKFFPDHHRFTDHDDEEILQAASAARASGLICTEKDLYNLHAIYYGKLPTFYCSISMQIDDADAFWRTVISVAERSARQR